MVRQKKVPVPKPPISNYDRIIYAGIISILALLAFVGLSYLTISPAGKAIENQVEDNIIDIKIQNFAFHPKVITIKLGQTVRWKNYNVVIHGIEVPTRTSKSNLYHDQFFSHTFNAEGVYEYHCPHHPNSMKGTIIVEEESGVFEYGFDEEDSEFVDFDKDGLPDSWESFYDSADCKFYYWLADSNVDGVNDGEEDYDNDSLSNLEEFQGGTNPCDVEEVVEEELEEEVEEEEEEIEEVEESTKNETDDDIDSSSESQDNQTIQPPVLDDDEPEPTPEPEMPVKFHNISIEDNQFSLTNLTIFEDEIVKWTNLDSTPHKIKSDDFKDSSLLYKNDTYQIKFSKDKVYNYICAVHPEMVGQIIVLEGKEAETEEIEIEDNSFIPEEITIVVGDTIQWINKEEEDMPHSIISEDFNSSEEILLQDQTYSFTFDEAGEYTYNCGIHSDMQGNIKVLSAEEYGLKKKEDKLNKEQEDKDECVPNIICGEWSFCNEGLKQTKTCVDQNGCKNDTVSTKDCEECKESWICDGWELCLGGQENRVCHDEHKCGTFISKPAEFRSCSVPEVEYVQEDYVSPDTTTVREFDTIDDSLKKEFPEKQFPLPIFSLNTFFDKFLIPILVVTGILVLGIIGLVTFLVMKGNKLPLELVNYVNQARSNKFNEIQIRRNLARAGWKDKFIDKALKLK